MKKGSGILLHVTSLPSSYGIGDLGDGAYQFVDFLKEAGQKYWQILPLNPTDQMFGNSPYSSFSAFGNNFLMISPDLLIRDGWLEKSDIPVIHASVNKVDYAAVETNKRAILNAAYERFKKDGGLKKEEYLVFCREQDYWLDDFSLFSVIKQQIDEELWNLWPDELRHRQKSALDKVRKKFGDEIERIKFIQFVFLRQWFALKKYANERGVQIIGDIPIYVGLDSVDVWTCPHLFKLDETQNPIFVSGVPPDYFSVTGQRWGNPVYDWAALKKQNFKWWMDRIRYNLRLFDIVRIDHFRGLVAYWEIPSHEPTAIHGHWAQVPSQDFFEKVRQSFPDLPIIAEDLGIITDDVKDLMARFGFPGMKIFIFAFNGDLQTHPYLPHNFNHKCVVYTGTHDNNTVRGWFSHEASDHEKQNLNSYLGRSVTQQDVCWALIELGLRSSAQIAIFPVQDILELDQDARMNKPGTIDGNWEWRYQKGDLPLAVAKRIKSLVLSTGRG